MYFYKWDVITEIVCTQPPYNDVLHNYFFISLNHFPFLISSRSQMASDDISDDVTQTQAPPTIVDWH